MAEFDFSVKRGFRFDPDAKKAVPHPGMWAVFLPHQCESWDIAGEGDEYNHLCVVGVPHAEAVAALELFIAEAQQALEALKAERELNADDE